MWEVRAGRIDLRQHAGIVGRVDHHGDAAGFGAMVLGGRAQHRRPADIDVFDGIGEACSLRAPRSSRKGYRLTTSISMRSMPRSCSAAMCCPLSRRGEQAAVDLGMQGLDAAVQDFRRTGMRGHFGDLQAGFGQQLRGAAGG